MKLTTAQYEKYLKSEDAKYAKRELQTMTDNPAYITKSMYSPDYSDGMPFVNIHLRYLSKYPKLDVRQYISNLKLRTRAIRTK